MWSSRSRYTMKTKSENDKRCDLTRALCSCEFCFVIYNSNWASLWCSCLSHPINQGTKPHQWWIHVHECVYTVYANSIGISYQNTRAQLRAFRAFEIFCLFERGQKIKAMNATVMEANGITDAARSLSSISTIRIIYVKWHLEEEANTFIFFLTRYICFSFLLC